MPFGTFFSLFQLFCQREKSECMEKQFYWDIVAPKQLYTFLTAEYDVLYVH